MAVNDAGINVTFSNSETSEPVTINSGSVEIDVDFSGVTSLSDGVVTFTASANTETDTLTLAGTASAEEPITGFGADLSGSLAIEFNLTTFDFTKITGSSINMSHSDFEDASGNANCLTGIEFEILDGVISKFTVGTLDFVHSTTKVKFSVTGATYENPNLSFDTVTMKFGGNFEFTVGGFTFNGDGSFPTIENLAVDIQKDPLTFSGSAEWGTQGFSVDGEGAIGDELAFDGSLTTGSDEECNRLYVIASFSVGTGIPIPNTPLRVNGAGAEFGYNYSLTIDESGNISQVESCGSYIVGASIEVSDLAGLVGTNLRSAFSIGNNPSLSFIGNVSVPAGPGPAYASGELNTHYKFWEKDVSGSFNASVKVPAGDGTVVTIDSGPVQFDLFGAGKSWRVLAEDIEGSIWDVVTLEGSVNVNGHLSPFDFQGRIDGDLSFAKTFTYQYPDDFDPTSCDSADDTDNIVGFGASGELITDLQGAVSNLRVTSSEITGSVSVNASAGLNGSVKWPCFIVCGDDCVKTYEVSASGSLNIERSGSETRLSGTVVFSEGDESEEGEIDLVMNGIF